MKPELRRNLIDPEPSGRLAGAPAFLFLAAVTPLLISSLCRAADEDGDIGARSPISPTELALLWDAQRAEIATAHVLFRCCNGSFTNPENTPERVAQLLRENDFVRHPEALVPFLCDLAGKPLDVESPAPEMTMTVSGRRLRLQDARATFVADGNVEAELVTSNRQVTLCPPGKSPVHHYRLADLRWIPPLGVSAADWRLLSVRDGVALYDVPPRPDGTAFQIATELDVSSGIVTHSITRYPDGSPAIEMYQSGLAVHSSGIVFPQVRIDLTYANGVVRAGRVIVMESARFNEPVDEALFALPVPEQTVVVDFRTAEKSVYRLTAPEQDALVLPVRNLDAPPRTAPAIASTQSPARRWSILIAVHVTVLLLLGAFSVFRRRSAAARRT